MTEKKQAQSHENPSKNVDAMLYSSDATPSPAEIKQVVGAALSDSKTNHMKVLTEKWFILYPMIYL